MTIPDTWAAPVRTALQSAFGVDRVDVAEAMSGGMSGAPVLKIEVAGRRYLMRLDPPSDGFEDPRRWHPCMKIAAEAGVAPAVHYADEGVSIVDFVAQHPTRPYWARERTVLAAQLGELIGRLHAAPLFPPHIDYLEGLFGLLGTVQAAKLLTAEELARPLERFEALAAAYRGLEPQIVSSHNDVNPRNIVDDGERLWLVDWPSAFPADRYIDLASIGSFFARDEQTESAMLTAYFGAAPTKAQRARLHLARLINHMFYALIMSTTTGGVRPAQPRPLAELERALRDGEAVLDSAAGRAEYGLARLEAMAAGVEAAGFAEACAAAR